ncbi:2-oxo acid dehydrogenase subunit E2 [Pseudomonas sp. NFX224]|uniref:2-oxo acid dehydrogenase subunit E2 n=1 Tax=Pseudomonas sp. NFX224 TaxID=3402862 RepID=UPI003AFAE914
MSSIESLFTNVAAPQRVDHGTFGDIHTVPLSKIQRFTGAVMARNWLTVPHVTHFFEADVTDLEKWRTEEAAQGRRAPSVLSFIVRAAVSALQRYPHFNASLSEDGQELILKRYYHVGIATNTPQGLLVPVIRDCDKKDLASITAEISAVAEQARSKGLPLSKMAGGSFTVSSLGALGGTGFTPIINAPEVAILGVSQTRWLAQPEESGTGVAWRRRLPLALSYDHRVINGVDAGQFAAHLSEQLSQSIPVLSEQPGRLGEREAV